MIPMPEKHPINWINALENDPTYKGYAHVDSIKTIETDTIK
jgi:hypothetical protein